MEHTKNDMSIGLLNSQSAVRTLDFGDTRVTYVVDGAMAFNTPSFFPTVPGEYWADHLDATDALGRVPMSAGGLLVERAERVLMIDAGFGPANGANVQGQVNCGSFPDTLSALGHHVAEVEVLALTHLHVDHIGWCFTSTGEGSREKTFPDARYAVSALELAPALSSADGPNASPIMAAFKRMADEIVAFDDGAEIFPGVRALVTPGHSAGHTSYVIDTTEGPLVVFGDAFHTPAQLAHLDWTSGTDLDRHVVPDARRRILAALEAPNATGFAFHFGDQPFGRVTRDDDGTASWAPVPSRALLPAPRALQ